MDYSSQAKSKDSKTYSLLLVGSPGVGKTAICKRYSENSFDEEFIQRDSDSNQPIWVKLFYVKSRFIRVQLTDCDDLHEDIMHLSSKSAYIRYDGYILCYSIENKRSFEMIAKFNDKLNELNTNKSIPKILLANKLDISHKRVISSKERNDLASEIHCEHYECSAKSGENIQEIIDQLVNKIISHESKISFSVRSLLDKVVYWFEMRKKMAEKLFLFLIALHLLTSVGVLGVAYYQGIYKLSITSGILTFALLVGLWDVVFFFIGAYSIIKKQKECFFYFLIALLVSVLMFLSLFGWQIFYLVYESVYTTEIEWLYSVYSLHLIFKLLLLFITGIIYQFKGINTDDVTSRLITEQ